MALVTIRGKGFVEDVRRGSSKVSLQRKYGLSERGLQRAMGKMVDRGFLTPSDVASCQWYEPATTDPWRCPACGRPQGKVWEICPICGVIVAKFEPKPQIDVYEYEERKTPLTLREFFGVATTNFRLLRSDRFFWTTLFITLLPLILTLPEPDVRIVLNSLLAAFIWAIFFKKMLVRDSGGWFAPLSAMLFTGFTGVAILFATYIVVPPSFMALKWSAGCIASLSGWVLQVGLCEEICKALPAFFYLVWKSGRGEKIEPRTLIIICVFSAIGFAATENVSYAFKVASNAATYAKKTEGAAVAVGIKGAMLNYMLRAVSLVFVHAVLSGIFGCFLVLAAYSRRFWPFLFVVGLGLSAGLHGLYDWLCYKSMALAALTDGVAFMIFYTLVMRPDPQKKEAPA